LLLLGFALQSLRAAMLAVAQNYTVLTITQVLDGITGAIVGVLTVLVITDLTAGSGRFNLARGAIGAVTGIGASISTLATGYLFQLFGRGGSFLAIAIVACSATALLWKSLSETKPERYPD
jgi:MFS family permease